MSKLTQTISTQIRQIVFGLEDGMVSTLGAITGLAGATQNRPIVIVSGLVIIAVESLSMAAGTYLSNKQEYNANNHGLFGFRSRLFKHSNHPTIDALYMGISYVLGGSIALLPYLFLSLKWAMATSILLVVISLFLVGILSGLITQTSKIKSAFEMVAVSLSAAVLGFLVGKLASTFFPSLTYV